MSADQPPHNGDLTGYRGPATGILDINLGTLVSNYRCLQTYAGDAECAAVVKGDAYGHGDERVAAALHDAGCQTFFVAGLREAERVRNISKDLVIYILDGLIPGMMSFYLEKELRPVLSSMGEIFEWTSQTSAPAALHVDTGMNRLGLSPADLNEFDQASDLKDKLNLALLMSHFACSDEPGHPLNAQQQSAFEVARRSFPSVPASLCASAGTLTRPACRYDMVRPGIALYGGRAVNGINKPTQPIATLRARILQIRDNWNANTVGYGATQSISRCKRIATIGVGYADGVTRHLSGSDQHPGGEVFCAGYRAPIVGRVSMDLITIDISELPDNTVARGDWVEIYGQNIDVDEVADRAGTIGYELLAQHGMRYERRYHSAQDT